MGDAMLKVSTTTIIRPFNTFMQVGFMFDNALPKTRRSFRFGDISVDVRLVDDDPGAVQVGTV